MDGHSCTFFCHSSRKDRCGYAGRLLDQRRGPGTPMLRKLGQGGPCPISKRASPSDQSAARTRQNRNGEKSGSGIHHSSGDSVPPS